jgi:hypothetical protein
MGNFVVEVSSVGGHGCQRDKKDGEVVEGCGYESCPDCAARDFVARLKKIGCWFDFPGAKATITHWPDGPGTVVDDLLTGKRSGSF